MANDLRPHTPEWFAELEKTNPLQAVQTRTIIQAVGRDDLCSICGDESAADYKLASDQAVAYRLSTLRLCDDCRKIRVDMHGERYVPLAN